MTAKRLKHPVELLRLNDSATRLTFTKNGKLFSRDYLSEYLGNDGYDKAWERLYNYMAKWLNLELGY